MIKKINSGLKLSFLKIKTMFLIFTLFATQSVWANLQCVNYLASANSQSKNYRFEQKNNTFPDLHIGSENYIQYTNQVHGVRQKDQCAEGCSFNSVASYIEAFLSFIQTGDVRSEPELEISANYMHAVFMFWQFRWALADLERNIIIGGYLEWSLLEFLDRGLLLEQNFKSLNVVDVTKIREKLSYRLSELRAADPESTNIDFNRESAFAFLILKEGFGTSPLDQSYHEAVGLLKNKNINSISFVMKQFVIESVSIGGDSLSQDLNLQQLKALADETIIKYIDMGLPLLLSYRHSSDFINPKTAILLNDPSTLPDTGHAALIVGYRLDSDGKVDMLKIQNSHANAPFFHMSINTFHELANALVYLTPEETHQ